MSQNDIIIRTHYKSPHRMHIDSNIPTPSSEPINQFARQLITLLDTSDLSSMLSYCVTQGVSVFGAEDTTLNSESALNVAINEHFGLKVAYNVTWNSEPPESAPEHTDRRTTLSLGYSM